MSHLTSKVPLKQASIEGVVVRCGCGDPASHANQVCPRPRRTEPLGTIAYYHASPWMRLLYRLSRLILPSRTFWRT